MAQSTFKEWDSSAIEQDLVVLLIYPWELLTVAFLYVLISVQVYVDMSKFDWKEK